MNLAARLGRLTPTLNGKERARMVLRAEREGREPDAAVKAIPAEHLAEYNHYISFNVVGNNMMGWLLQAIEQQVTSLEERLYFPKILEEASGLLARESQEAVDPFRIRAWRKRKNLTVQDFLLALSVEALDDLKAGLEMRWMELRSVEALWAEFAEEFDGEDIVLPELREKVDSLKERCVELASRVGQRRLKEPEEAFVDIYRELAENAMKAQGFWEFR